MSLVTHLTNPGNQQKARPVLVVEDTKGKRIINLDNDIYSIGRDLRNSIVLYSKLVSRHHATLLKVSNPEDSTCSFQIIDGDLQGNTSTNGLIINGKRCSLQSLQHRDLIIFGGNAQAFYFVIDSNLSEADILKSVDSIDLLNSSIEYCLNDTLEPEDSYVKPLSEAALLRLASFPELLPSPIIEIDLVGTITYLNSAALKRFPELQEVKLNHPILVGLLDAVQNEKKKFFVREVKVGTAIFEQSVHYIAESRLIRSYLINITERKLAEAEIYKSLAKERELVELKSSFISMTSHEFRTPLATILSATELLQYYAPKLSKDEKRELFRQIETAISRMTQLLEDLLTINKAEAGKMNFKPAPFNLEKFCRHLVAEMQMQTNKHEISFAHSGNCTNVMMDEKLLRHIFSNLLANAIKYSPDAGVIEFKLTCENGEAIFQVKDSGIGIPLEDRQKLFESFHRASNVGTIPGTGLGLSIVKKMVDLHDGSINLKSEVGAGTTFTVTIPFSQVMTPDSLLRLPDS